MVYTAGYTHGVFHAAGYSMVNIMEGNIICHDVMVFPRVCRMVMGCPMVSPIEYPVVVP